MTPSGFMVLGSSGFVGGALSAHLRELGHNVLTPTRHQIPDLRGEQGHVVYCVGLTGDFRSRTDDTIDAHVLALSRFLHQNACASFLYLSSTRLYGELGPDSVANEQSRLPIVPSASAIYDLTKLLGESLVLKADNPAYRVARLANVCGSQMSRATFLMSVLAELRDAGRVTINESRSSSKDYVGVDFVVNALRLISTAGRQRIYNVSSGVQTTHAQLSVVIESMGAGPVTFNADAPERRFPIVSSRLLCQEFGLEPPDVLSCISAVASAELKRRV